MGEIQDIVILAARTFGYREPERERQKFANTDPTFWRKRERNCLAWCNKGNGSSDHDRPERRAIKTGQRFWTCS